MSAEKLDLLKAIAEVAEHAKSQYKPVTVVCRHRQAWNCGPACCIHNTGELNHCACPPETQRRLEDAFARELERALERARRGNTDE